MTLSIDFHPSQWPEAVAHQMQDSLRQRRVPGLYLYDSPAQSARWLAYHEGWSPARTRADVQSLYDRAFRAVLNDVANTAHYVSLGCGGGQKDARWVSAAADGGGPVTLTDSSASLLITASRAVASAGARDVRRVVIDLSSWPGRATYGVDDHGPVVWSCLGILPNFEHERLLPYLADLMAPSDRLVLSANLSAEPYAAARTVIVPQYDNPLARAWYDGALVELGFELATTERRLVHAPVEPDGGVWRMQYLATPRAPVVLDVYGARIEVPAETQVQVFQSTRYTPERLPTLCQSAGLLVEAEAIDPSREEGVFVLRRAG